MFLIIKINVLIDKVILGYIETVTIIIIYFYSDERGFTKSYVL